MDASGRGGDGPAAPDEPRTRREVLGATGGLLAGAALSGGLPGAGAQAAVRAYRASRPPTLWDIEHVVIMMQENRSFDHYFGTLGGVRGFGDPTALVRADGRSVFDQELQGAPGTHVSPYPLASPTTTSQCPPGLVNQSWDQSHTAWDGGKMDQWLSGANAPMAMGYLQRADLPFYYALADAFTTCDAYHCSVLGPTDPNRLVLFSGMIDPGGRAGGPVTDNNHESGTLTWTTYPERLQAAGVSWRVYHEADEFNDNSLRFFAQYQRAPPSSPLYENALRNRDPGAFADDVATGRLPQVSWIIAPTAQAEHPGNGSSADGENFVSQRLSAVLAHPRVWAKTVFLFCHDEHGGFFDHVPPPVPAAGTPDELVAGAPIGLGFRVPMVICSPFTRGANVCRQTFDHTSIIRFLELRFGVHEPNISAWRRRTCGDLTAAFDFSRPDYSIPALPATAPLVAQAQQDCQKPPPGPPPATQTKATQEPATRRVVDFPEPVRPPVRRLAARAIVSVTPARVRAGRPTRISVRVHTAANRPVAGATVSLAGRHARTDRRGVATFNIRLRRRRHRYRVTAHVRGYAPGAGSVRTG